MTVDASKAPFPWFGGKSQAAPLVWRLLGDVPHYVEPFAGSLAVLLRRPHPANRRSYSETVNDLDGLLVNAWRAIQQHPVDTAEAASWPVSECDLMARQIALVRWRTDGDAVAHLRGDPSWCDPVMAGWWLWGVSSWIGSGWCSGSGAWTADEQGRAYKQPPGAIREPGVSGQLPDVSNDGRGVNNPTIREPGVDGKRPHVSNDGMGVNTPAIREQCTDWDGVTMPGLLRWFRWLSARLRHVRILNGDWARSITTGATLTAPVRGGKGPAGVFVDPPYADTADRTEGIYAVDSFDVAHDVRAWCVAHGDNPLWRIVLAGFDGEHGTGLVEAGWTEHEWFTPGYVAGGMGSQQTRERLWASPHCIDTAPAQQPLFTGNGT